MLMYIHVRIDICLYGGGWVLCIDTDTLTDFSDLYLKTFNSVQANNLYKIKLC